MEKPLRLQKLHMGAPRAPAARAGMGWDRRLQGRSRAGLETNDPGGALTCEPAFFLLAAVAGWQRGARTLGDG